MKQSQANEAKFKGRVSSEASDCVVGRKVVVFRKEQGQDQKLEKTFATESGKWRVKVPMQAGNKLYAVIDFVITPLNTRMRRRQVANRQRLIQRVALATNHAGRDRAGLHPGCEPRLASRHQAQHPGRDHRWDARTPSERQVDA